MPDKSECQINLNARFTPFMKCGRIITLSICGFECMARPFYMKDMILIQEGGYNDQII